ncbi:hypothetical protein HDV04_003707 [Boothiomyces sp. JEL0838]|nr:hypothetical protein HDV04_003707 [Boothiomyces sp. JEL0838]
MLALSLFLSGVYSQYAINERSVGATLFLWSFKDIAEECVNFLAPNGYSFVMTAPVVEHINSIPTGAPFGWYLNYQVLGYNVGNRMGTLEDFKNMTAVCTSVGVDVIVDVVLNHNSGVGGYSSTGFGYSNKTPWTAKAFSEYYPDPGFTSEHYHDNICNDNIDWTNQWSIYNCRLETLVDLATEHPYVRQKHTEHLNYLLSLGVAGFRADATKSIPLADFQAFTAGLNKNYRGENPFFVHEIMYSFPDGTYKNYQSTGRILNFDYSQAVGKAFRNIGSSTDQLANQISKLQLNQQDSVTFVENHDTERNNDGNANYALHRINNAWWYKQAVAFNILYPYGMSIVHSGYNFQFVGNNQDEIPVSPPSNSTGYILPLSQSLSKWTLQHRMPDVYPLVRIRNYISSSPTPNIQTAATNQIYWSVPGKAFVAINSAQGTTPNQLMSNTVQSGLAPGKYCNFVYGYAQRGKCVLWPGVSLTTEQVLYTVDQNGFVTINIGSGDQSRVLALYSGADGVVSTAQPATTTTIPVVTTTLPPTTTTTVAVTTVAQSTTTQVVITVTTTPTVTPTPTPSATITFKVTHQTSFGDNLYVVGTFNNWNACAGVACSWTTGNVWLCGLQSVSPGASVQWKPIVYGTASKTTCSNPMWYSGNNQVFTVVAGSQTESLSY